MKAVVKEKKGYDNINYKEVPDPAINDDEVLVKVMAAGICGSDLHIFHDVFPYWPPVILGHEFAGVIVEKGRNITRFEVGDRVTSEPQQKVCGVCRFCRAGKPHLCAFKRSPGWGIDGAMAEYIKISDCKLHKIPDNISFIEGAVIEPASTVTHAVIERGNIKVNDFVVVTGAGAIGLIAAQVARACGARRIAITGLDIDEEYRLQVARELEIDFVLNVQKENLRDVVMNNTEGYGADLVAECSGSESAVNDAIEILAKSGRLVGLGLSGKERINIKWDKAVQKEIEIIPSMSSTFSSWKHTISLLSENKLNLGKIISDVMPLSEYRKAFEKVDKKQGLKIVLVPDKEYNK